MSAEVEPQTRRHGWPIVPFAIAVVFFVIASFAIWYSLRRAAQNDIASLHDRETAKEVDLTGEILEAGRLPLPDFVKELTAPRQVIAATPASGPMFEFISPVATAMLSARPTFRWKRLEGGWNYQVRVSRLNSEIVVVSGVVSSSDWTPETDFAPGITYQWQVLAQRGSERVVFPQAPQAPPRFRVTDQATAARLRDLAERRGGVHILLAIEYGKAGLIEDARRELRAELPASRHAEAVERLIRSLDTN